MEKGNERPRKELFVSPDDVIKAHEIVEEELGPDFDAIYSAYPKSTGNMGDEGFLGHTVLIFSKIFAEPGSLKKTIEEPELLGHVSNRICNETRAACRVVIEIASAENGRLLTPQVG